MNGARIGRLVALSFLLGVGCTSKPESAAPRIVESVPSEAGPSPLVFSPCKLLTDPPSPPPPTGALATVGEYDGVPTGLARLRAPGQAYTDFATQNAECATMRVPAMWSTPTSGSIDVFVKRYAAKKQPAKAQLWMLAGGPGSSGAEFETDAFLIARTIPDFDIYIPDLRGTGNSTFATCVSDAAAAGVCTDVAPPLDGLTMTDGAKDLSALIDATRGSSQQLFVLGVSYGTMWAQRYLQLHPDQATGVILDSSVPALGHDYATFDLQFDDNARSVLELCKADATCLAKIGPDPIATARQALAAVDAGVCSVNQITGDIRDFLGDGLLGHFHFERNLLPAAIHRILRCNDADLAWFGKVKAFLGWVDGIFGGGFNFLVWENISLSESWPTDLMPADVETRHAAQIASSAATWLQASQAASEWPRYPHDQFFGKWPSPSVPMLILQGSLDPRTPFGDVMKAHYSGRNQYYVELPGSNHAAFSAMVSPMVDPAAAGCGWQVIESFLEEPTRAPDTSCTGGMTPVFGAPPKEWFDLVGIDDLWENP